MASLTIRNIRKAFGAVEVLKGINIEARAGEFIALVGPSGCGKSTLLAMIAGLETISSGEIYIGDRMVNSVAPKDRDIAMVFQSYALYPTMTVRENMAFGMESRGVPRAEQKATIARVAALLQIEPLLGRKPGQLSGGQRQRVAMGRALVRDPELFLFDEPLSNLDAKLRVDMRTEIKKLHNNIGKTTVYVTHDQVEAMTLADRIVVMRDGHVEQIGSPLDLYDRPASEFVAGFIGTPPMNLLTGHLAGGVLTMADGTALPVPPDITGPLTLGIRPEHLSRADTGWPVTVRAVEMMGHETHVTGLLGTTEVIFTMTARDFPLAGQVVHVLPDPALIHLFRDGLRVARPA